MRGKLHRLAPLLLLVALPGCVSTAVAVVKAPFQVAGWGVDKLTVSQSEADRNRGRRERHLEEDQAKHDRKMAKERRKAEREAREDR